MSSYRRHNWGQLGSIGHFLPLSIISTVITTLRTLTTEWKPLTSIRIVNRSPLDSDDVIRFPVLLISSLAFQCFLDLSVQSRNFSLSRTFYSHIYMAVTTYKYLRRGERCQEHKEFDCTSPNFLGSSVDHMCMNVNLVSCLIFLYFLLMLGLESPSITGMCYNISNVEIPRQIL